jgi:hypothetical protein
MIVKGFVNKSIENMPEVIQKKISDIVDTAKTGF